MEDGGINLASHTARVSGDPFFDTGGSNYLCRWHPSKVVSGRQLETMPLPSSPGSAYPWNRASLLRAWKYCP